MNETMTSIQSILFLTFFIALCNINEKGLRFVNAKFFEYELPNRTITICPSYSLISIECPQIPSSSNLHSWQLNHPKYLISIDYIRSFPLRLGFDPRSCQPDLSHACNNYDLRYINSLCNGQPHCADISTYQIRERSLCAFKAVTEIAFHCVPTWDFEEIRSKYDICKNSSLINDYGFIYSSNYPSKIGRHSCFTTIYTRPNYKLVLYFVNGELNHDQLRIESVTSNEIPIVNITLNGNLSTQRLAVSNHEIKITFLPSPIYSYHPTYYLLYFYLVPTCNINDPCPPGPPLPTTTPFIFSTTSRNRVQSAGWTRVQNIWIVIPIVFAYILLLLLIIVLALLLQRRRKQKKLLGDTGKPPMSSRYLDTSGASSRAQLVPPMSAPPVRSFHSTDPNFNQFPQHRLNASYRPSINSSFSPNLNRSPRASRSDFDLRQNNPPGIDYLHHASIPYRVRSTTTDDNPRGYGTMDHSSNHFVPNNLRRSLPKSFSDCDLCKQRIVDEEYQRYNNDKEENWHAQNSTIDRRTEPKVYQDKVKEHFRERVTTCPISDSELPPPATAVEYSTVLPRHQRMHNESSGFAHHLPVEYIPNEYPRGLNEEHAGINNENRTASYTVKYYERDDEEDSARNHFQRRSHDSARESQQMSMRMNDRHQHQYYHQ